MSTTYKPPVDEIKFILRDALKADERTKGMYEGWDWGGVEMLIDTAAQVAEKTIFPLSAKGDQVGAVFKAQREKDVFTVTLKDKSLLHAFDNYVRSAAKSMGQDLAGFMPHPTDDDKVLVIRDPNKSEEKNQATFAAALEWHEGAQKVEAKLGKSLGYGTVTTPDGFKEAYQEFAVSGLIGLLGSTKYGGSGAPHYAAVSTNEMMNTNFAAVATQGLSSGAAQAMEKHASDAIKDFYLSRIYSGEWSVTMCLTEDEAGSSMKGVKTAAVPKENGKYDITGFKRFITSGAHDYVDPVSGNVCHLVLAKLPGDEEVSLFLVPGKKHDENGVVGENNGVYCTKIEEKMGIHASPTCELKFEGSEGVLVGKPGRGLEAMFTMMKDERLNVATQGLATAVLAQQNSAIYADQRKQGEHIIEATKKVLYRMQQKAAADKAAGIVKPKKLLDRVKGALCGLFKSKADPVSVDPSTFSSESVTIGTHANVKKDLFEMATRTTAWRTLTLDTAINLDVSLHHQDEKTRRTADAFYDVMTPILKACVTDFGLQAAQRGAQLHGGMGFIKETGVEQFYRDAFIATIYEGTNPIQAMDFTFRKPKTLPKVMAGMYAEIKAMSKDPVLKEHAKTLRQGFMSFYKTAKRFSKLNQEMAEEFARTGDLAQKGRNAEDILMHSEDFMNMFGKLSAGMAMTKVIKTAAEGLQKTPNDEMCNKMKNEGDYFISSLMAPEVAAHAARIKASTDPIHKTPFKSLLPRGMN